MNKMKDQGKLANFFFATILRMKTIKLIILANKKKLHTKLSGYN